MPLFARWDLSGVWLGEYWYHADAASSSPQTPVPFRLVIRQGMFGAVTGTVQDDAKQGIPDEAKIRGRLTRTGLLFQKQYPVFYVRSDDVRMTLRESLKRQGFLLDSNICPVPIEYRGTYDEGQNALQGTWIIRQHVLKIPSGGQTLMFDAPESSGSWQATREG